MIRNQLISIFLLINCAFAVHVDGRASAESVSALSFEEHDEPTLRLRSRQVKHVDIKLENRSTEQKPPRVGSPSIHRVSLVVIVLLLCAGTAWFLNPWGS